MARETLLACAVAALFALALLYLVARARYRRWRASRLARSRGARAVRGEHAAERLLERAGYRVLDRQPPLVWTIRVDRAPVDIDLRADLLVERDGRRLVAEVKTGDAAPRVDNAATRRQLLEYLVAYEADGICLVDATTGSIQEVDFGI